MKISNLLEMATPASMPAQNIQAPKFGRSDEMLESGVGTSVAGNMAPGAKSMGKIKTRGQGSMFKGISTSSKYANSRKAGISEDAINEDDLSEEQLQAKKRREENFKKAKDRELGNKPQSREIMAKEGFNGEYDDEAGMFKNNLQTIQRVSMHLEKAVADNENLPEWCQEKIGVAKSMVVTVMDYIISQHENGERPTVDEGYYNNYDNNRTGFAKPKRDLSGEGEPAGMFMVMIDGRPWKEFTSNMAFDRAKSFATKNPDKKVQVRWPNGQLNTVKGGMAEGEKEADYGPDYQAMVKRVGQMAKQGERKTVWDPVKRVYKTVPVNQPKEQDVTENNQRVDSLVTDALKIMQGTEVSDAVRALKTVLGDREYNSRRGHYNFYVKQLMDMYSQQGVAEEQLNELDFFAPVTTFIKMTDGSYVQADWRKSQGNPGLSDSASFVNFKPVNPNVAKQLGLDSHQRNNSISNHRDGTIVPGGPIQGSGPLANRGYEVVDYNKPETMEELPPEIKSELIKWVQKQGVAEGVRDLSYDAQSLIMKLRRDVEEKRLQPTRQAVLAAARELAGDMDFAPELLVQQVLGKGVTEGNESDDLVDVGPALHGLKSEFEKFMKHGDRMDTDPAYAEKWNKRYAKYAGPHDNDLDDMTGDLEVDLREKSTSQAQFRTMAAVAHNPKFAKKVGIKPSVGKEFHKSDRKQDYKDLPKKANEGEGNFVGDSPQPNIGGETVNRLKVGDTVTYFGQTAKILAQSKPDRKRSRIEITKGMGGVTQDVLTSDLKRTSMDEESKGLWANIHAKRERIKHGSGEKMRKPGSKGAPTASALRKSAT